MRQKLFELWKAVSFAADSRGELLIAWMFAKRNHFRLFEKALQVLITRLGLSQRGNSQFPIRINRKLFTVELDINSADRPSFFEVLVEFDYKAVLAAFHPDIVIDAGAHIGFFTILASVYFPDAVVHAFEPSPRNATLLRKNTSANKLVAHIHEKAIWHETTELQFEQSEKNNSGHINESSHLSSDTITVKATSIFEAVEEIASKKCLIKLDIEGAELKILPDLLAVIKAPSVIFLELHNTIDTRDAFLSIVAQCNWQAFLQREEQVHSYWVLTNDMNTLAVKELSIYPRNQF